MVEALGGYNWQMFFESLKDGSQPSWSFRLAEAAGNGQVREQGNLSSQHGVKDVTEVKKANSW